MRKAAVVPPFTCGFIDAELEILMRAWPKRAFSFWGLLCDLQHVLTLAKHKTCWLWCWIHTTRVCNALEIVWVGMQRAKWLWSTMYMCSHPFWGGLCNFVPTQLQAHLLHLSYDARILYLKSDPLLTEKSTWKCWSIRCPQVEHVAKSSHGTKWSWPSSPLVEKELQLVS